MIPSLPPTLDTLTIIPAPRASIRGSTASVSRIGAKKFTAHDGLHLGGVERGDGPALGYRRVVDQHIDPAERIPRLAAPARRPPAVSARSATHIVESGEDCRQSASTSASRSRLRAIRPTTAPSLASARASAAPTPDEAPVTSTRLPGAENPTTSGWREWPVMTRVSADIRE